MKRFIDLLVFTLITASLVLTGCSGLNPALATETPTQVPQFTIVVDLTPAPSDTPIVPTATQQPTDTPVPTEANTPSQPPSATASATLAATLANTPITLPSGQIALVNQNTNCRGGPSAEYPFIVAFLSGESAKIVSRTSIDSYILVEDPNNPGQSCWLWTKYVTISGDLSSLPVATPPPPLVNFTMDFTRVDTCGGYILEFKVVNTGQKPLEAYTMVVKDLATNSQQTTSKTTFDLMDGCFIAKEIGSIDPGNMGYAYAENFSTIPTGHIFEATITICSHNDMTGACATQVVRFSP